MQVSAGVPLGNRTALSPQPEGWETLPRPALLHPSPLLLVWMPAPGREESCTRQVSSQVERIYKTWRPIQLQVDCSHVSVTGSQLQGKEKSFIEDSQLQEESNHVTSSQLPGRKNHMTARQIQIERRYVTGGQLQVERDFVTGRQLPGRKTSHEDRQL